MSRRGRVRPSGVFVEPIGRAVGREGQGRFPSRYRGSFAKPYPKGVKLSSRLTGDVGLKPGPISEATAIATATTTANADSLRE